MPTEASDQPRDQGTDGSTPAPVPARAGVVVGLGVVAVLLATVVALLLSPAREDLPDVAGLDYRVVQVGVVLVVAAFSTYVWERERRIRALGEEITVRRVEAARMSAEVVSLQRDMARQREMEQLQRDLVSIVSHEVRGPLAAIKGFSATLLVQSHRMTAEDRHGFLEGIDQQADRLARLVEDLLEVQTIDAGALRIRPSEVDLESLTRGVVTRFSSKWGERRIVMRADPGLPAVPADPARIEEVLANLIDNAVKYSPRGGDVGVALAHGRRCVEVSVSDAGIGIPADEIPRLFQKFHRIACPETRGIGGSGLGLYIVKGLVEAHGGRICVASRPGEGSTFTFSLPLEAPGAVQPLSPPTGALA